MTDSSGNLCVIPLEVIKKTPGLLGRMVTYFIEDTIYPQPQLALGAAITTLSVLKAGRVKSESNLRTNILAVGLAGAGWGKGTGLKKARTFLTNLGYEFLLAGVPESAPSVFQLLSETGRKLIVWDEFGLDLKEMTSKNAPAYKSGVIKNIMSTFSSADEKLLGRQYQNRAGNNPRIDIYEPCLSMYAVSTEIRFSESLNSKYVIDGFMPRILIFRGIVPKTNYSGFQSSAIITKESLLGKEIIKAFPIDDFLPTDPTPIHTVPFSQSAKPVLARVISTYESSKNSSTLESVQAIYGRAIEHFIKLCLVVEDGQAISLKTAEWVESLLSWLMATSVLMLENISDSEEETKKKALTDVIKKEKFISRRDLCRKTRGLTRREREALLEELIEAEVVERYLESSDESRKNTTYYKICK